MWYFNRVKTYVGYKKKCKKRYFNKFLKKIELKEKKNQSKKNFESQKKKKTKIKVIKNSFDKIINNKILFSDSDSESLDNLLLKAVKFKNFLKKNSTIKV